MNTPEPKRKRTGLETASLILTALLLLTLLAGLAIFIHPSQSALYILVLALLLGVPLGVADLAVSSFAAARGWRPGIFGMAVSILMILACYAIMVWAFTTAAF